jgi:hypothetical protein
MTSWLRTIVVAAIAGDVAITLYLIVERAVEAHIPLGTCLLQLMQWDASNAYGNRAFAGGWPAAGLGQLMDLVVSLAWASIFAWLWARFAFVRHATWAWGLAFGVAVMIVMLYIVVPLGHARAMHASLVNTVRVLVAHTVFFGLPVALVVASLAPHPRAPQLKSSGSSLR